MIISRERYLDDSSLYQVGLNLQTRTREMHSLLSDASEEVRAGLGEILARALDEMQALLAPVVHDAQPPGENASFGCGT